MGDVLWTWRITFSPEQIDVISLPIERIFDHPLRFLSYEGPVQNKTGQVKIADKGDFRLISEGADELCIDVRGNILQGICILTRQTDNLWMLARRGSI